MPPKTQHRIATVQDYREVPIHLLEIQARPSVSDRSKAFRRSDGFQTPAGDGHSEILRQHHLDAPGSCIYEGRRFARTGAGPVERRGAGAPVKLEARNIAPSEPLQAGVSGASDHPEILESQRVSRLKD